MAHEKRGKGTDIGELFEGGPHAWNFFNAVRHIESRYRKSGGQTEGLGFTQHPSDDPVRFGQEPALAFPPSDIAKFIPEKNGFPPRLSLLCFGLLGCNGPMPLYFSEHVYSRVKHKGDPALRNFLDMFHHRLISLFYRAWAVNQQTVSFEQGEDVLGSYIGSLIGRGRKSAGKLDKIPRTARYYYSGRLIHPLMNAEGLCAILGDYFKTSARIRQFVGQWIEIPEENRCRLGETPETGEMGKSFVIGSKIWDCRQKFRIVLGPMSLSLYNRLVPGNLGFERMKAWVKSYVGMTFDWEIQMVLAADEVPPPVLGKSNRLGLSSWLRTKEYEEDADDLVLKSHIH